MEVNRRTKAYPSKHLKLVFFYRRGIIDEFDYTIIYSRGIITRVKALVIYHKLDGSSESLSLNMLVYVN